MLVYLPVVYVISRHGTLDGSAHDYEFSPLGYEVEVILMSLGTSPLYARLDGTTATIAGDDTLVVPGNSAREFVASQVPISGGGPGYKISVNGAASAPATDYTIELKQRVNHA
ncbi:MAG: hypothetical protein KJN71_09540 [Acidimicrobiia bacterium]|nr:hypothetical protein [Acidimicrobiia bacterium]